MSERRTSRMAPPASVEGSPVEESQGKPRSMASPRPVRSAQRPQASSQSRMGERVARAWGRHPIVAMVRHRRHLSFYVGLHGMLRSGVSLSLAFTELSRGADKDPFLRAVANVGKAVSNGAGLAEAMRSQPAWFEPQVVAALEAGEVSGTLENALAGIIARLEALQRLRWRTFFLCLYPVYLLAGFIVGGALLDAAAGAVNAGNADNLGSGIVSAFLGRIFSTGSVGLALFLSPLAVAALGLEERWERVRLRLPLLGGFHRRLQASRFCDVLGTSLGAGVDAARSLQMAIEATGSTELRARTGAAVQRLRGGATFAEVVEWLGVLEGESLRQVGIGERAGRIEPLLQQQARENSEAALRGLRVLMIAIIVVAVACLMATNIARIFEFQADYFRRIEQLSHG
ncbi:MAG: type II secretion system F family protein [Hyalangium sp.]|uniref:type II secretion system F family protein n=1 Tax=Hyalangium sp. TaxID=2028555 RepID=UPI00389A5AB9